MLSPRTSILVGTALLAASLVVPANSSPKKVDFKSQVKPILAKNCFGCHSGPGASAGLDLSTTAGLKKGGESGRLFVPKKGAQSLIVKRLRGLGGTRMPQGGNALPDTQVKLVQRWIDEGAKL